MHDGYSGDGGPWAFPEHHAGGEETGDYWSISAEQAPALSGRRNRDNRVLSAIPLMADDADPRDPFLFSDPAHGLGGRYSCQSVPGVCRVQATHLPAFSAAVLKGAASVIQSSANSGFRPHRCVDGGCDRVSA